VEPIFSAYFEAVSACNTGWTNRDGQIRQSTAVYGDKRFIAPSGLTVTPCNFIFTGKEPVQVSSESGMVELTFMFESEGYVQLAESEHELVQGNCALQFMHNFSASFHYKPNTTVRTLSIGMPFSLYEYYSSGQTSKPEAHWKNILGGRSFCSFRTGISPEAWKILHELSSNVYAGSAYKLYTESKALELLSLLLQQLLYERGSKQEDHFHFSRTDRQKIREARSLIVSQMDSPPSLLQLSKMAGINDFKLKKGFKEEYGMSVFAYLRLLKLERAKEHLLIGKYNVGQAASMAGYTNASHFAEAFRRQFGINPSELLRRSKGLE